MSRSILIVGCGIAGPALASLLLLTKDEAPHITILERSPSFRVQGQNVDVRGAGVMVIRRLGLESVIRSNVTGEEGVVHVDSQNHIWGQLGADKTGKVQTATSDIEILRGKLAEILYLRSKSLSERCQKEGGAGIEYIFGDRPVSIQQDGDGVIVVLASGLKRKFDVVIAADGLQSSVRKLVFGEMGEPARVHKTGMYGGFFNMPREKTDSQWRRWFHAPGRRGIMIRPSHEPDRVTVFLEVLSEQDKRLDDVAALQHAGVDKQKELLEEYFRGTGWETDRVLREMKKADDFYYDIVAQIKMDRWSKGRVVLLGDAGYCASPISGMGTTLALTGAYNLAGSLSRNSDLETAFDEYEAAMRPVVEKAQKLAPGMPWLLHPETAWGLWALNVFLACISYSGIVTVLSMFLGPPANSIPVDQYDFEALPDGWGWESLTEK